MSRDRLDFVLETVTLWIIGWLIPYIILLNLAPYEKLYAYRTIVIAGGLVYIACMKVFAKGTRLLVLLLLTIEVLVSLGGSLYNPDIYNLVTTGVLLSILTLECFLHTVSELIIHPSEE